MLSAILWVLRTGAPWRDLPERLGPWSTAWSRFRRWRQQPGAPAYCTDMKASELPSALAATDRSRLPARRDFAMGIIEERLKGGKTTLPPGYIARLNKILYL